MKCNKLSVNFKKTSYIIFKLRQKKLGKSFSLSFGNQALKQVNETKFLGVYIYENLTWKPYISFVAKQIPESVSITFDANYTIHLRLSLLCTIRQFTHISLTVIQPDRPHATNLNIIFYLQKRVVQVINNSDC